MKNRKQRAWISKYYCRYARLDRCLLKLSRQLGKVKECFCTACKRPKTKCGEKM